MYLCFRNQHTDEVGTYEEIGFEQFLMVMSHFRPPTLRTTNDEKQVLRREKLRCMYCTYSLNNGHINQIFISSGTLRLKKHTLD